MSSDNIKSHKKPPLSRRYIFGKTTDGDQVDPLPAFSGFSFFHGADIRVIMRKKF